MRISHGMATRGWRVFVAATVLAALPVVSIASTDNYWTGTTNSEWLDATNWDRGLPSSGDIAHIEDTYTTVTLAGNATVDGLVIGSANGLNLAPTAILSTQGLNNLGILSLFDAQLQLQGGGSFTNSGTLSLCGGRIGGSTLVNDHIVQIQAGGLSRLDAAVVNNGNINLAAASALDLVAGYTYTDNGHITLNATATDGTIVRLVGSGSVTLDGTGSLETTDFANNTFIANASGITLVNGASHTIHGAATFDGSSRLFTFQNAGTVTASGTAGITIQRVDVINTGLMQEVNSQLTLWHVDNTGGTIRADGGTVSFVPSTLLGVEGGSLQAVNGGTISFQALGAKDASLEIAAGATAQLTGASFHGGSIDNRGLLELRSGRILNSAVNNSGILRNVTGSDSMLDTDLTNTGTIELQDGSLLQICGGRTYTNDGQITLNAATSSSLLSATGSGTVALAGSGTLLMGDSLQNAIRIGAPDVTLLNGAAHTIRGGGTIGGSGSNIALQNEGTIVADTSAGLVFETGLQVVNHGTIKETNSSLMLGATVDNHGGTILADGGTVDFYPTSSSVGVSGGDLKATNGGRMRFLGTMVSEISLHIAAGTTARLESGTIMDSTIDNQGTIEIAYGAIRASDFTNAGTTTIIASGYGEFDTDLTNTGTIEATAGGAMAFLGGRTYTNNGQITLNAASGTSSVLLLGGSGTITLAGSGSLVMSDDPGNIIAQQTSGLTLVNGSAHHITGSGSFYGDFRLENRGFITATGPSGLTVQGSLNLVNSGIIEEHGSQLALGNAMTTNTGGTIRADGGTFVVANGTISGGNIEILNAGTANFYSGTLQNVALRIGSGANAQMAGTVTSGGSLNVEGMLSLQSADISSSIANSGTIRNLEGGGSKFNGGFTNTGTIEVQKGSAIFLSSGNTYTNNGQITLNAVGSNSGGLLFDGAGGTVTLGGTGMVVTTDASGNIFQAMASGMTFINGSGHTIIGSGMIGNSGLNFRNDGTLEANGSSGFNFINSGSVLNNGTMKTTGQSFIQCSSPFTNTGNVSVASGTRFLTMTFEQTAGSTVVDGMMNAAVLIDGGSLGGSGEIYGSLSNGGNVNPGNSPGTLAINGNYTQLATGTLNIEVGKTAWDMLNVNGTVQFAGTLNVSLVPGDTPVDGGWYTIAQFLYRGGSVFDSVNLPNPWSELEYRDNELLFHYIATPEPAAGLLMLGAFCWLLGRKRR